MFCLCCLLVGVFVVGNICWSEGVCMCILGVVEWIYYLCVKEGNVLFVMFWYFVWFVVLLVMVVVILVCVLLVCVGDFVCVWVDIVV